MQRLHSANRKEGGQQVWAGRLEGMDGEALVTAVALDPHLWLVIIQIP